LALLLVPACFKPNFDNKDAGFLCYATDNPPCPPGKVCCIEERNGLLCGEMLRAMKPNSEGRCMDPPPPTMPMPWKDWDLGTKTMVVGGTCDPMLDRKLGPDSLCLRDDKNPDPPPEIVRQKEPNDMIKEAVGYTLQVDPPALNYSSYQICPDKAAPGAPDVDVFRIVLRQPARLVIDVQYRVDCGDIDVGLFRTSTDETGAEIPQLISQDISAQNNACIEQPGLAAGTYYVAVRGAPKTPGEYKTAMDFAMNDYRIKIYGLSTATGGGCKSPTTTDMRL
jgi:hypothetical protein